MTIFYIDVSHYDWDRRGGNIDWSALRDSGMEIMIARSSYGDPSVYLPATRHYEDFSSAAKSEGFFTGGYHNLIHGDNASMKRQVEFFRRQLDNVDANWAMLDVEPYQELKNRNLVPKLDDVFRFSDEWNKQEPKRILTFYIARWVWESILNRISMASLPGPIVSARYSMGSKQGTPQELYAQAGADNGAGWQPYGGLVPAVWQFSSTAIVHGASTQTDVNAYKGTAEQFKALVSRPDVVAHTDREQDDMLAGLEPEPIPKVPEQGSRLPFPEQPRRGKRR